MLVRGFFQRSFGISAAATKHSGSGTYTLNKVFQQIRFNSTSTSKNIVDINNWPKHPVPKIIEHFKKGEYPLGSYIQQRKKFSKTPSGDLVEVDHMTPVSLHLKDGESRTSGEGAKLSKYLPAAALNILQHRRKPTTGSSKEAKHHRAYLKAAHHGFIPFAGPMENPKDHYAAAMEIELRSTTTKSTLFGPIGSIRKKKQMTKHVSLRDAMWGLRNQKHMLQRVKNSGRIDASHVDHLKNVVSEIGNKTMGLYKK